MAALCCGLGLLAAPVFAAEIRGLAPPSLYTTYALAGDTSISWTTCGTGLGAPSCYGSGTITGFERPCALLETPPGVENGTTTSSIYILDSGGTTSSVVSLKIYKNVSTVSGNTVASTISQSSSVALPLRAGAKATCVMSSNGGYLYAGTDLSVTAVIVDLTTLAVSDTGSFSPAITVRSSTASDAGYVIIDFAGGYAGGFVMYGPNGALWEDGGGGGGFIANSINAVILQ